MSQYYGYANQNPGFAYVAAAAAATQNTGMGTTNQPPAYQVAYPAPNQYNAVRLNCFEF